MVIGVPLAIPTAIVGRGIIGREGLLEVVEEGQKADRHGAMTGTSFIGAPPAGL
jgi:hypothetical protein